VTAGGVEKALNFEKELLEERKYNSRAGSRFEEALAGR
jgi:hypothetical protein